jgi:hypothetical protein
LLIVSALTGADWSSTLVHTLSSRFQSFSSFQTLAKAKKGKQDLKKKTERH